MYDQINHACMYVCVPFTQYLAQSMEKDQVRDFFDNGQYHQFGEIQPGLVYERMRDIPDPFWKDFSMTALEPMLLSATTAQSLPTYTKFECPITTYSSKLIIVATYTLFLCQMLTVYIHVI